MEKRALWLMVWGAAWVLAWVGSFLVFALTDPVGDGFVRGMNRVTAFLGWQAIAGMLAFAVLGAGRAWPVRHPVRRASVVPLVFSGILAAALVAVILWAGFPVPTT